MKKITIYCIDMDSLDEDLKNQIDISDEDFIKHSEIQGLYWDINEFENAFNQDMVSDQWIMRIITSEYEKLNLVNSK